MIQINEQSFYEVVNLTIAPQTRSYTGVYFWTLELAFFFFWIKSKLQLENK